MSLSNLKSPGWKAILGLCRAIKNRELTKDDFDLYDVESEHQEAYCYLVSLYSEDIGERAFKCINELHEIRKMQIKNKDYTENKEGKYRVPPGRVPGSRRLSDDSIRTAINMIMGGSTLDHVCKKIGCNKSNFSNLLRDKYKFSPLLITKTKNANRGKKYVDMRDAGSSIREIARLEECETKTIVKRIEEYRRFVKEGMPMKVEFSEKVKNLMGWE